MKSRRVKITEKRGPKHNTCQNFANDSWLTYFSKQVTKNTGHK